MTVTNISLGITTLTDSPDSCRLSFSETVTIRASFTQPVTAWTLWIMNSASVEVRRFSYSGTAVTALTRLWDGCDARGRRVPAGTYRYILTATAASSSNGGTAACSGTVSLQ